MINSIKQITTIEDINKKFYDDAYTAKNIFWVLLHSYISFDQQSKAKRNYKILKSIFSKIPEDRSVKFLDYGFGLGSLLIKMPKHVEMFGCDISESAIVNMRKIANWMGKKIILSSPQEFPLVVRDIKFDLICCSHILEHVEDDEALLKTLCKYLKDDGKMLINVPINEVWNDPKHVRKYTLKSISQIFERCGLRIDSASESDRWTAFFLQYEQVKPVAKLYLLLFRFLRFILAIIPLPITEIFEFLLPSKYKNQQLIILTSKL